MALVVMTVVIILIIVIYGGELKHYDFFVRFDHFYIFLDSI